MITTQATILAFWGITMHLAIDWLLQNDWMAVNKSDPYHPAAWTHSGLHLLGLLLVFPLPFACAIAFIHLFVDTRIPLKWWRRVFRQTREGEVAIHVAIWSDQVAHWLVICAIALLVSGH